jgi:hypothetical protein
MPTLPTELRSKLERTCIAARQKAEPAALDALLALGVSTHRPPDYLDDQQRALHSKLRARAQQLGDLSTHHATDESLAHLAQECAYEHWHRMLFARFLAENNLLMLIENGDRPVSISLKDCKDLADEEQAKLREQAKSAQDEAEVKKLKAEADRIHQWALAGRYAQTMLPEVFRADDPVLQVPLAREDQLKLEQLLDALPPSVFTASDSLGWCYQFWQAERKEEVNESGNRIGADELPPVTQLFTEDYMVDFLLDNTLGAWWAGRCAAVNSDRFSVAPCPTEEAARRACALPGVTWNYLRFVRKSVEGVEVWTPAAGTFEGWPKTAKELRCLDPCMGSGHFVVAMLERLVALRMAEERLDEKAAVEEVIHDNLFGLEIDPRCTQIGAFNLALAAWRRVGHCALPGMNLACSGLAPNAKRDDWVRLAAGNANQRFAMGALYDLFQKAPVLGSLINPHREKAVSYASRVHELQPLLEAAMKSEKADEAHELAVTAQGIAKATEILAGRFTLAATNVPYLGRGKQVDALKEYCDSAYPDSKWDLATAFFERCQSFCRDGGTVSLVTPQQWCFGDKYLTFRGKQIRWSEWNLLARLGTNAFQTISGEVVNVILVVESGRKPSESQQATGMDLSSFESPEAKAAALGTAPCVEFRQLGQLENPDSRITLADGAGQKLLGEFVKSTEGLSAGDGERFIMKFWEGSADGKRWAFLQSAPEATRLFCGLSDMVLWEGGKGDMALSSAARVRGHTAWGRPGIVVAKMNSVRASVYLGGLFAKNCAVLSVSEKGACAAVLEFVTTPGFAAELQRLDANLNTATSVFEKVPFDVTHWQRVAGKKYQHGLPKPFSSDPREGLFSGHPYGSEQPLHVGVARLVGYQWPRQTGSSFPDCPALGVDGLEAFGDADGIVCIPSVRGEEPAADRLRKLLAVAYGKDWKAGTELELIRATGSDASDLEEWLRNDFLWQHCDLFHQRPFIWHIWDGRKRDGFHALLNYHKLAAGEKGRKVLESLTHSYLGEWITRQKDGEKRGEAGAEERLAAGLELKKRLEAVIEGEPPFDIFVRWKPLAQQAIGWEPDINDGVRMNIRPFLASDLPNGKAAAGILRWKPNTKWDKDRGKEPQRAKGEFPWFWPDGQFTGDRVNDVHLTNEQKRKARKE